MVIELEAYHIFLIVVTVIGAVVSMIKMLGNQIKNNIDQQLNTSRESSEQGFEQTQKMLADVASQAAKGQEEVRQLERQFLEFKADMPFRYIARDDYIRGQTVIEAKLDAVAEKLEKVQIKQGLQ